MWIEFQKTLQGLTKLRSGLDFPEQGDSEMFPDQKAMLTACLGRALRDRHFLS